MTVSINGTSGIVFNDASSQNTAATGFGFKNRIINGAMVIDQRNNGASVTPNGSYMLDRWAFQNSQVGKFTAQQNSGSVTPPAGFANYLGFVSTSAYSLGTGDYFTCNQYIEGFNSADLAWGTASAATVTLSFWVRSSLTGTFGGTIYNSAGNRGYVFSYTINAANTWEQKSVTIAGDQSGTWLTNNGIGIVVRIALGAGSSYQTAAGSWSGTVPVSVTGQVNVAGTNGATFYITGVQLEKGSTATSFDYRPYSAELALCQRYYYKLKPEVQDAYGFGQVYTANDSVCLIKFPVTMRTSPSALEQSGTASDYRMWKANSATVACTSIPVFDGSTSVAAGGVGFSSTSLVGTAGQMTQGAQNNANGYLAWSAEL